MRVRAAVQDDLLAVAGIGLRCGYHCDDAAGSWPPTLTRLQDWIASGCILVVEHDDGRVIAFVVADRHRDHLAISPPLTDPDFAGARAGEQLLDAIRRAAPELPVAADIVLGDLDREQLHESHGFFPGEIVPHEAHGVDIVTRRWWAEPLDTPPMR